MLISPLIDPFAIHNIVEDTSPQLGGDLDVNNKEIKLANNNLLGWWAGGQRKSYIQGVDSCCNLKISASEGTIRLIGKLSVSNQSRCCVFREDTTQSIPSATVTKVQLNSEKFDQLNEFDSSANYRFTASEAGYYLICFSAGFRPTLTADKKFLVMLYVNGASAAETMFHSSHNDYVGGGNAIIYYLDQDDYVELYVFHNSAASVNLDYTNELTFLAIERLS